MTVGEAIILGTYFVVLAVLALYGGHRWQLVWWRRRARRPEAAGQGPAELPVVTVQLPVYNERFVVTRLLDAACRLRWPADRLEIQLLDDSTDDTSQIAGEAVARWRARGVDVVHLRRPDRSGYKAGALAHGLTLARGELIAIFDADFVPPPDFLEGVVPHFADPGLGMVQTRWGHLNRTGSLLTEAQAILLDAHFLVEHVARSGAGSLFNFNGTAGVWRRQAILDAEGWQGDTLTEDLDLSYRSQLAGWRFRYLPDQVVEAEIPAEMTAFKRQQHRWAKGSIQTCLKLLPRVLRADLPLAQKREAFFHLTGNFAWLWMVLLSLLLPPAVLARSSHGLSELLLVDAPFFILGSLSVATFFVDAQREVRPRVWERLLRLPLVIALGVGMSVTGARAVLEALAGHRSAFVRTPKLAGSKGAAVYRTPVGIDPLLELALAAWLIWGMYGAAERELYGALPFLGLFAAGYLFVAVGSVWPAWGTGSAAEDSASSEAGVGTPASSSECALEAAAVNRSSWVR